ncbi:MAG TPA: hypothetical protein VKR22_12410 [Acidimicrobiales bacterium]|nr:hypothetical protein [Acidimicrobiales bacterium]
MATTSHGIQVVERERVAIPPPIPDSNDAPDAAEAPVGGGGGTVPVGGLGLLGVLTLLVGAWGGIVPFIGPMIGADGDGTMSWFWSLPHAVLWLAPGAAACVAAAVMLGALPRAMAGFGRISTFAAGLLAVVAGAWFVIGPEAWPVLVRSAGVFVPAGPLTLLGREVAYSFGPGAILLMLGAMAMAVSMTGGVPRMARTTVPAADRSAMTGRPVAGRPVAGRPVTPSPVPGRPVTA